MCRVGPGDPIRNHKFGFQRCSGWVVCETPDLKSQCGLRATAGKLERQPGVKLLSIFSVGLRGVLARMRDESGQGLAEYALILVFIAIVAVAALTFLGPTISNLFSSIGNNL